MALIRALTLLILISTSSFAFQEAVVSTDTYFHYVPASVADGYSRDATLTIASTDDIDVCWYYEDDSTCTAITEGNQTDSCPPGASQACLTHLGNGAYKVGIDAALVNESGKQLCIDVSDEQGTRTVGDTILCKYVYPEDRVVTGDLGGAFISGTAEAGSTTTTIVDSTNLTSAQANAYVGTVVEVDGETAIVKSFNPGTDTITLWETLSAEPDSKTYTMTRDSLDEIWTKIRKIRR